MKLVSRRKKLNTLNTHNTRNRWIKTTKRTTKRKTDKRKGDKRDEAQKKGRRCIWIVGGDEIGMTGVVKQTVKKRINIVGGVKKGELVEISAINNSCDGQRLVLLKDLQQINSAVQLRKLRRLVNGQFSKKSDESDIQTNVFFVTTQHTLGWLGLNPVEHAALLERIFLVDVRDGGWNWKWWVRHKKLQLSEMTKCQIVTQKRKCLASQIDYFYKKIEIVLY